MITVDNLADFLCFETKQCILNTHLQSFTLNVCSGRWLNKKAVKNFHCFVCTIHL